jgi:hypothetical protein
MTFVTRPSSTVTLMPQNAWQKRQNDSFSSRMAVSLSTGPGGI